VRLLLDTHVLLWWLDGAERLSEQAANAIGEAGHEVLVSAATLWEISIKQSTGKLRIDGDLGQHMRDQWFRELAINGDHAAEVRDLPWHHRDPFDRMLVAQARYEGLTLVTADSAMDAYDVRKLPAN
jgi:PIN domain nuclease of toxin-antitoxin system